MIHLLKPGIAGSASSRSGDHIRHLTGRRMMGYHQPGNTALANAASTHPSRAIGIGRLVGAAEIGFG